MDAEEWTERGVAHGRKNEYRKALQAFEQALDINPKLASPWHGKGVALNKLGRYEEALQAFEQALGINPEEAPAWHGKGNALRDMGRPRKALEAYEQALDLNSEHLPARQGQGNVLLELDQSQEALEAFEQVLDLNPKFIPARDGKGSALLKLDQPQEALRAFEQILELNPEHASPWIGKGNALRDLGRPEKALKAYEQALDLDSELDLAWKGQGSALRDIGRPRKALEAYEQALDINPELALAWHGKGNALRDLERPEEALRAYEQALDVNPDLASAWANKGGILSDEPAKPVEARRSFLRVLHLADHASNPQNQQHALEAIPFIINHFQNTGSAPLLIVSLVERHELLDVYLREPRAIRHAYERAAPYRLLKYYFDSSLEGESKKHRKHSLLGLAAFYLGDPFLAQKHFDRLDTLDDQDLFGAFYYARTHQEYARDEDAKIIIDVSREHARSVLQRANQGNEIDPRQCYYAGQLFASGSDPKLPRARECFEAAANRRFLPAMYMRAWAVRELKGLGDAHDSAAEAALEEEEKRNGNDKEAEGYFQGQLPEFSGSPEKDLLEAGSISEEEVSAAIDAIEQLLWYRAHQAEIIDAIRDVQDWLGRKEEQVKAKKYDLPEVYQRFPELDEWIANRQHTEVLQHRVNEREENVDLAALHARLQDRTKLPEDWLVDDRPPEEWEEWLGERIRQDEEADRSGTYQELITYLALRGQITGGAALALSGYLLATNPSSVGDVSEREAADALLGGLLGTGGSELLSATVTSIAPLVGPSIGFATSVAASFIGKRVRESAERQPEYPVFREEFDKALEGQPDEAYEMIQKVLDQIESRQASPAA